MPPSAHAVEAADAVGVRTVVELVAARAQPMR